MNVIGQADHTPHESGFLIGGSLESGHVIGQNECLPTEGGSLIGGGEESGHVIGCCLEMLSLVLLILALRRFISFHLFAGGPLTFLVNSGVLDTRYTDKRTFFNKALRKLSKFNIIYLRLYSSVDGLEIE